MQQNVTNLTRSDSSSLDYKQIDDTKQILKYIFVRRIQLAVILRDMAIGSIDANPVQVAASKTLLAALKDMELTARQDALDGIYTVIDDNVNNNFTEGLI